MEMDIQQIWEQFHKTHSDHSRNVLMEHYMYLVKSTAEQLSSQLPDQVKLDDLICGGIFGLMDAIDDFDPTGDVEFEAYSLPRIKEASLRELQDMDGVPESVCERAHQLLDTQNQHIKDFLSGLTRAEKLIVVLYYYEELPMPEIAKVLDLSEGRVSQMHSSIIERLRSYMRGRS